MSDFHVVGLNEVETQLVSFVGFRFSTQPTLIKLYIIRMRSFNAILNSKVVEQLKISEQTLTFPVS